MSNFRLFFIFSQICLANFWHVSYKLIGKHFSQDITYAKNVGETKGFFCFSLCQQKNCKESRDFVCVCCDIISICFFVFFLLGFVFFCFNFFQVFYIINNEYELKVNINIIIENCECCTGPIHIILYCDRSLICSSPVLLSSSDMRSHYLAVNLLEKYWRNTNGHSTLSR